MTVNIVAALPAEAKPLIDYYELRRKQKPGFRPVYESPGRDIRLLIGGVGKDNAARAVTALNHGTAVTGSVDGWLNVGIAGHGREPVGTCLMANRITDRQSGDSVYPHVWAGTGAAPGSCPLVTVRQPERDYGEAVAYDMEGYGFFRSVSRYTTLESIRVCKIISDNPASAADKINPEMVAELMQRNLPGLGTVIESLGKLSRELETVYGKPAQFQSLLANTHLTASQRVQVLSCCRRLLALDRGEDLNLLCARPQRDGRHLLHALQSLVNS